MAAKDYILLTKPGIIVGNALTTIAGFFAGSRGTLKTPLLGWILVALSLIVASACICNNFIDREIDARMPRTRQRALAAKKISPAPALLLALLFAGASTLLFLAQSTLLVTLIAWSGFLLYVFAYSFLKHRTPHATLIGSVSGAIPPVVGYVAASHHLDMGALALFSIVLIWQMPHFFAIALYRQREYAAANIPVLPISRGIFRTKVEMSAYSGALVATVWIPTWLGVAGPAYLLTCLPLSLGWLGLSLIGFQAQNSTENVRWARRIFFYSLFFITIWSFLLSI